MNLSSTENVENAFNFRTKSSLKYKPIHSPIIATDAMLHIIDGFHAQTLQQVLMKQNSYTF